MYIVTSCFCPSHFVQSHHRGALLCVHMWAQRTLHHHTPEQTAPDRPYLVGCDSLFHSCCLLSII